MYVHIKYQVYKIKNIYNSFIDQKFIFKNFKYLNNSISVYIEFQYIIFIISILESKKFNFKLFN